MTGTNLLNLRNLKKFITNENFVTKDIKGLEFNPLTNKWKKK